MQYGLGIIGYGGMGEWHYRNIKERISMIKVVGVYDIRPERMEKAGEEGLITYENVEALLKDEQIHIVTIAVPNNFHHDLAIAALRAGKHVICEKPVMMNAKELEEVIAVQEETGRLFSVHQNRRWDKDFKIIQKIVEENTLGQPYYIESRVQGSRRALHGWRGHKVNGGGMLLDWGVHLIDQMLCLIPSEVEEVYGNLLSVYSEEVDDNFKLTLKFATGEIGVIEVATNCFINQARWHMSCTDGTAVIEGWDCKGKMMSLHTDQEMAWEDEIIYTEAGPTRTMAPRPIHTMKEEALPEIETHWTDYYKNIIGAIEGTEKLLVTPQQALRVLKVIDQVFNNQKGEGSI